MNKQQLANKIWESANKMRSKIEANEYKDYILGFIFYKYLSDRELEFLMDNDYTEDLMVTVTEEDSETVKWVQNNIGYFIAYDNLFATWIDKGKDFDVADVHDALSAFSRLISSTHKKVFDGVFTTLQTGLSKLGDTSGARTKAISGLLQLIRDIPMDGRQGYDVLGFIYEYLIEKFAANAGKKAGEFYTPHEVSLLISEIVAHDLRGKSEIKIYDPTSGSGSLLINIGHSVAKYIRDENNVKYYAQELKENTYNLTRMNLVMRGIKPANIVTRNGDTLEEDWPYFEENDPVGTYDPLYVDAVVSNPPYSQAWDPENKEGDPRYARFGLAPKGKADYAFLLHDLFHIKPDGIMAIVLPHGVLFRGGEEGTIRRNLIENNHIDTIIGLPANIFYGTGIPTIIIILKQQRENTDVLIVDASKGFAKEGKNNKLRASDIKRISDAVIGRCTLEGYARVVSREEIRSNMYNLNIPRYVDTSQKSETWDLYATMYGGIPKSEIDELTLYWQAFPGLRGTLFENSATPYTQLAVKDIGEAVCNHPDILGFEEKFNNAFDDFGGFLKGELIAKMTELNIAREEAVLSDAIFGRLEGIPLIDRYEAYQLLDEAWEKIAVDLEIIQTEGFGATTKVDPRMVIKKKNGKEQEIQDGWTGRILPFALVQSTLLKAEHTALVEKENRLAEIPGDYEAILEALSEEERDSEILTESGDAFVAKEIPKRIKALQAEGPGTDLDFLNHLKRVEALIKEEKALKAAIKRDSAALELHTKETIEGLPEQQVNTLLERKWIKSLLVKLLAMPDSMVKALVSQIQALSDKYDTTFFDIETQIQETEKGLAQMIDTLDGSPSDLAGLQAFKGMLMGELNG